MNVRWWTNTWEYARQWMADFGKLLYIEAYEVYDCECPECPSGQHAGEHNSYYALVPENHEDADYLIETLVGQVNHKWYDFEYTYLWTEHADPVSVWEYDRRDDGKQMDSDKETRGEHP